MVSDNTLYNSLPVYQFSDFRQFYEGEYHINRVCANNVLILMFSGTLHFTEDGIPVSVSENEYYIQKAGLLQEGTIPIELPYYYFIHFDGDFDEELYNIPIRGTFSSQRILELTHALNTTHLSPTSTIQ